MKIFEYSRFHSLPRSAYGFTFNRRAFSRCMFINTYTDGGGCHARCQPARQEQFGVQYLAQGHFDMQTRGIKPAT